ncbi:MAG: hypothetical protein MI919_33935, partial [Holophagales bacterium]|nr:hypothetical protein [Holophagales bacterium]
MDLQLARDLYLACGGTIDASGLGWAGGDPAGVGLDAPPAEGAGPGVGGSHGGRGGLFDAAGDGTGRLYGNLFDPTDPGAGAGGSAASAGGGVVRIAATGDLVIDGELLARGGADGQAVPHGAGGSVRLDGATIGGLGLLDASGAGSSSSVAGGGGGRVALYAGAFDVGWLTRLRVTGGPASTPAATGAPGTLFTKLDAQALGELHVLDHGVVSSQLVELPSVGAGVIDTVDSDAVTPDGFTDLEADFTSSLAGLEVEVAANPARRWTITDHAHHGQRLDLDVSSQALDAVAGEAYRGLLRLDRVVVGGEAQVFSRDPVSATAAPEIAPGALWQVGYLPGVSLTAPADGAVFTSGDAVVATAVVDDPLGIAKVRFTLAG